MAATKAQKAASAKYDASHTIQVKLKLNTKTDADILEKLDAIENKQGYIKDLIRRDTNNCIHDAVLDKIRAELHATAEMHEDGDYYLREKWIDEIIDKYKAEIEKI